MQSFFAGTVESSQPDSVWEARQCPNVHDPHTMYRVAQVLHRCLHYAIHVTKDMSQQQDRHRPHPHHPHPALSMATISPAAATATHMTSRWSTSPYITNGLCRDHLLAVADKH